MSEKITDENNITWVLSKANQMIISQSRDEPADYRATCLICHKRLVETDEGFRCDNCKKSWTHEEMIRDCDHILGLDK